MQDQYESALRGELYGFALYSGDQALFCIGATGSGALA
jgi:hypothetical protein